MAMCVNVRVELRPNRWGGSSYDKERALKMLLQEFKRRVDDLGIMHTLKDREFYESKSSKKRKKRRVATLRFQQERIVAAIERGESPKGASRFLKRKKKKKNPGKRQSRDD